MNILARSLSCKSNSFPYERLCTRNRFDTEVKCNSEMHYSLGDFKLICTGVPCEFPNNIWLVSERNVCNARKCFTWLGLFINFGPFSLKFYSRSQLRYIMINPKIPCSLHNHVHYMSRVAAIMVTHQFA